MRKCLFVFPPLIVISVLLSGCANQFLTNKTSTTSSKSTTVTQEYDYNKRLKQCLGESEYLSNKDKASYAKINNALIQMLSVAKEHSSQLDKMDEKNKEIITSMYVFQVNDLCNTISQYYLAEVKKDLNKIVDNTKSK